MKNKLVLTISIGLILQWLSLFFSYRELPDAFKDTSQPIATAGFPFKTFEYPVPPLGSDWPPPDAWPAFFLNLAIWLLAGLIITLLAGKQLKNSTAIKFFSILALLLSAFGVFYIMFKFD